MMAKLRERAGQLGSQLAALNLAEKAGQAGVTLKPTNLAIKARENNMENGRFVGGRWA